jgi:hypothetical protein
MLLFGVCRNVTNQDRDDSKSDDSKSNDSKSDDSKSDDSKSDDSIEWVIKWCWNWMRSCTYGEFHSGQSDDSRWEYLGKCFPRCWNWISFAEDSWGISTVSSLMIRNGTINTKTQSGGAGIGSGSASSGIPQVGDLVIVNGIIRATGSSGGAGIG